MYKKIRKRVNESGLMRHGVTLAPDSIAFIRVTRLLIRFEILKNQIFPVNNKVIGVEARDRIDTLGVRMRSERRGSKWLAGVGDCLPNEVFWAVHTYLRRCSAPIQLKTLFLHNRMAA